MQKIYQALRLKKKLILQISSVLCAAILMSAGIEYFFFGQTLRSLSSREQGHISIDRNDIILNGFTLDDRGFFVSQSKNATLNISTHSKFSNNLIVELADTPHYSITLTTTNQQINNQQSKVNDLSKVLKKGKYDFLPTLTFPIHNNTDILTLTAQDENTVISNITIDNTYHFNTYRFAFFLSVFIVVATLFFFRKSIGTSPEWAFLVIAITCGACIIFVEPSVFVSWDERIHYRRSDNLSFKNILPKTIKDNYAGSDPLPYDYSIEGQRLITDHFDHDYRREIRRSSQQDEGRFKIKNLFSFYTNLSYVPTGVVLFLGRLLHLPWHIVFALGRFFNIIFFSILVFFSMRKLETGKMILTSIALLPTSLFIASNYNYDAWLTGFLMLGMAYLFTAIQEPDKKLSNKDIAIMIGAFVVGLAPKAIYFPLLLLLLFLKPSKFLSIKEYKRFIFIMSAAFLFVISSFLIPLLFAESSYTDHRGGSTVNSSAQIQFILSHPITYTHTLITFVAEYIHPLNALGYTNFLAYLGVIPGFYIILLLLLIVTLVDRNIHDEATSHFPLKLSTIGIFFATVALLSTSLYISFTPVGLGTINGVQPRYLIPLLFPFLFILGSHTFHISYNKNIINSIIFALLAGILFNGIWMNVIRLYY